MNIFELIVVQPIFNLLISLYAIIPGGDFGVSLVVFTIIVRLALWPLIKKQLHQTKAMRRLQPELARIKKHSKGNRQLESMQMMELYKKHGVSPFRSIGILLIQLPIFIALFSVIQIFTLHRDQVAKFTYDFLESLAPIKQIIERPDQFNEKLFGFIDLTQHAFSNGTVNIALVIIAVAAAALQYVMSKQTMPQQESKKGLREIMAEAAEGKQADQAEMNAIVMNKMIKVLPFFMFVVMLSVPGALAVYYAVGNLVAVIQQKIIIDQDKDELETIAEAPQVAHKKATAKAREKQATEGKITRISAKDTGRSSKGKKS